MDLNDTKLSGVSKRIIRKIILLSIFPSILLLTLFLAGCSRQDYINNKETGEISSGQKSELHDGTYTMLSTFFDRYGYRQQLEMTVCSGLITKAAVSEVDISGNQKSDTPEWPKKQTGMDLSSIYHHIASQIIERQDAKIDTITGATKTISDFSLLAENFQEYAKKGEIGNHEVIIGDTYHAEVNINADSLSAMDISFDNNNNITKVEFSEIINGISRNSNSEYKLLYATMCEATMTANNLSPLTPTLPYPQEYERYNTLLNSIANQRKGIR